MRPSRRTAQAAVILAPLLALLTAVSAPAAHAATCGPRVPGDVNGDGFADLVTTETTAADASSSHEVIRVLYGAAGGLTAAGNQAIDSADLGAEWAFDFSLTSGFFNDDCYADIAAGAIAGASLPRPVLVLYGSPAGPNTHDLDVFTDIDLAGERAANFAAALAAGDFDGDGLDDLAVGASRSTAGDVAGGAFGVLYGGSTGLDRTRTQWITQDTPGVPSGPGTVDQFGHSLAAADFTGDGRDDLAVGSPGERIGTVRNTGAVTVLAGSAAGLDPTTGRMWHQNSAGVPGANENNDRFGATLAAGDMNDDGRADLAIGAPWEAIGDEEFAGAITVIRFGGNLTPSGFQAFHQNTPGVPGTAERVDWFGFALAFGDVTGDGRADLAIGSYGEAIGTLADTGSVTMLYGATAGLTTGGAMAFTQASPSVPGANESGDQFGWALHVIRHAGAARYDLAVGSPGEDVDAFPDAGGLVILNGGSGGLTGAGSRAFYSTDLVGGAVTGARLGAVIS
jgi:hypothetical protein